MNFQLEDQIGEIVAQDFRTAAIFKANGIDFCCRGHRTLGEALNEKGLSADDILKELDGIHTAPKVSATDYDKWKPEHLIDHIVGSHHAYVRNQIPVITSYLDQICKAHGNAQPALFEIRKLFAEDANDLMQHLQAEESIVFPMIRDLSPTSSDFASTGCVPMSFFQQMISTMEREHEQEGIRWQKISDLTQEFQLQFGCNVAHVTFSLLKEFYDDLTTHIHLENNILFPEAMDLKNKKINANQS